MRMSVHTPMPMPTLTYTHMHTHTSIRYGIIEGLLPAVGFINGKAFPTPADLSILLILKGCMPFQVPSSLLHTALVDGFRHA